MPVVISTVSNNQEFATWLLDHAVPNLFKSVSYDPNQDVITATDDSDNIVMFMNKGTIRAYRSENSYIEFSNNYSLIASSWPTQIISCDNGFMTLGRYGLNGNSRFALLVAKTNNGEPSIIFNNYYGSITDNSLFYSNVKHVSFGDHQTLSTTLTFTPESAGQTVLAPFATDPEVGNVSYTPYAFYIPVSQSYNIGLGKFRLGSDTYITNGYWCIKT